MVMCDDCGAVFSSGIALGPGASFSGRGNYVGCPRCGASVEIPDGEYGVIDGAVRWLRQFRTAEQRAHLADVLQDADQRLRRGESPEVVAAEIERSTGLRVWDFLTSSKGGALAGWVSFLLSFLVYLSQQGSPPPPARDTDVTVNLILPAAPSSVDDEAGESDGGRGQDQHEDGVAPVAVGDIGEQHEGPAASHQGQG